MTKSFSRNVFTLASGAALAQVVTLLAYPFLTRLYTPQEFGMLALYVVWLSNLAVLATARYELAIVLPDKEKDAANLLGLALLICLALSALLLLLTPLRAWFAHFARQTAITNWLLLLPLSLLFAGCMQAYTNWNNRHQRYLANAASRIAQVIATAGVQVGAAFAGLGAIGLLFGQLFGQLTALLVLAAQDLKQRCPWTQAVTRTNLKQVAKTYSAFPRINTPHAFTGALQDTLTITFLTMLSGSLTVGLYGLMIRVLKLPAALVGQSIAQVTYRDMANAKNSGQSLLPMYKKTLAILLPLALVPSLIMLFAAPMLFAWVFGASWKGAGEMAAALSPYMFCHFIASPLGMIPLVINRQRAVFIFSVLGNILFLGALLSGFFLWNNVIDALWLVSAVMLVYFVTYFYWLYRAIQL